MILRKLSLWAFICLTLQIIFLGALNTYLFGDIGTLRTRRESVALTAASGFHSTSRATVVKTYKAQIPAGARHMAVSYDNRYAAFGIDGGFVPRPGVDRQAVSDPQSDANSDGVYGSDRVSGSDGDPASTGRVSASDDGLPATETAQPVDGPILQIRGIGNQESHYVCLPKGSTLEHIQWLPDRHRLFYILSTDPETGRYGEELELWYYDMAMDRNGLVKQITDLPAGSKPALMSMSTYTNLLYITVDTPDLSSRMYRIDIMGECRRLKLRRRFITGIQVLPKNDAVYFEEADTGKILVLYRGSVSTLQDQDGEEVRGHVLGLDGDEALLAKCSDNTLTEVSQLLYADGEGKVVDHITLAAFPAVDSIVISDEGEMLKATHSSEDGRFLSSRSGIRLWNYQGEVLKASTKYIVYMNPNPKDAESSILTVKQKVVKRE